MKPTPPLAGADHSPADHGDSTIGGPTFDAVADICTQLMQRYGGSSASQHRHLIATAAAMKSVISDDSLPLSPLSYFAATMTALSEPAQNDAVSTSALATLLSIVLPLVPEGSISPDMAVEAVRVLVRVLEDENVGLVCCTSSVRCVVKCLGVLLGFCDSRVWDSVKLPFETLLKFSVDKRPKVRKCALVYLENALKTFQCSTVMKKASTLILSLLESYASMVVKLGSLKHADESEGRRQSEAEHSDVAHVLNVVKAAVPYLSDKISVKVVLKLVKLLDARFSALSRIILNAIEGFVDNCEVEIVTEPAGDIITVLILYVSSKSNPKDNIISAAKLLKCLLDKIHAGDADKWNESVSPIFNAIAGLLTHEDDVASQASNVLKNLICHRLSDTESKPATDVTNDTKSKLIASICSVLLNLLDSGAVTPNEHTLAVISVLFLELGENSFVYMRNIVLKLAELFTVANGDNLNTDHLQKCFGCAVVAMGAENVLTLIPISFSMENLTCSNTWLLPILKKYMVGATIGYFMEHVVPIAKSLQKASRKVKKSVIGQDLQAHARSTWGLLPAFCRYPTDICRSLQSFTKLVLIRLEKDSSSHEDISLALEELVKQSKFVPKSDEIFAEPTKPSSDHLLEDYLLEKRRLRCFSKKQASKNLKALSLSSLELLQALMNVFLVSPSDKRSSLKKAISGLASISDPSVTKKIFILFLERFPLLKAITESGEDDLSNASDTSCDSSSITDGSQWLVLYATLNSLGTSKFRNSADLECLILDLVSSIVEGADEDLVDLIFKLVKHALQIGDEVVVSEAYSTLSCVLEEHPQFCSSNMDKLVDLLIGLKSPADVTTLSNRLSCLHTLLVHALKSDFDADNKKPFLILNEIILTVKDSKEEARKTAYDILLRISSSLGGSHAANADGPYYRLISMIMGYLSGPSPHVTSAAISALSVLVFKEPELCLTVPDVVPSVASLLQSKAVEVVKAVLGFIKVFVSCLEPKDLQNFISVIIDGIIPWSSVSRHHFKSKVTVILEIMIRKCGLPAVKLVTPERYQAFVKTVSLNRHGKTSSKETDSAATKPQFSDTSINGQKKRARNNTHHEESSLVSDRKKRRQYQDNRSRAGMKGSIAGVDKKGNHFKRSNRTFNGPEKFAKRAKKESFSQASGKFWKRGGASSKQRKNNSRKQS